MEFIGRRGVDLKKRGNDSLGLCPFHQEKTPSFSVNSTRGTFKCFGCNEGGDVFGFVMKTQSLSFPDAVRSVAAEVGIEIAEVRRSSRGGAGRPTTPREAAGAPAPASSAGPSRAEVVPIGDAQGAKIEAVYDYRNRRGQLVYQVCRMAPKSFRQRRPHPREKGAWVWTMKTHRASGLGDQPTILYRAPELRAAIEAEDPIWIAEGEKDVEALMAADQVATCNTAGAGKWRAALATPFKGFQGSVRIVQDRDEPGKEHARAVFDSLAQVLGDRASLAILEPLVGKDAADHLGAGKTAEEFVQVWPLPNDLLETDPKRFKRIMLHQALEHPTTVLDHTAHGSYEARTQPLYQAALQNVNTPIQWQGCVVVSGAPSSGKSYLAIATAVDSALAGWDAWYLSCEMAQQTIRDRAARAVASRALEDGDYMRQDRVELVAQDAKHVSLPDRFNIVDVGIGVTVEDVIEFLADRVTERPTLVVLDSVSSFVDNMVANNTDGFGMAQLREVTRWVTGVSRLSHGSVAFLILSELNKEGRAKGRSLDHRCDYAISMVSSDEDGQDHVKTIRTTKSWHGRTGKLGQFVLWHQLGRLSRSGDG